MSTATPLPAGIRRRRLKETGAALAQAAGQLKAKVTGALGRLGEVVSLAPRDDALPTHAGRPPCSESLIMQLKRPERSVRWETALQLARAVHAQHPTDDPSWARARKLTVLILHDLLTWFGPSDLKKARKAATWYVRLLEAEPARALSGLDQALQRIEEQKADLHARESPAHYTDRGEVALLKARIGHYDPLIQHLEGLKGPLRAKAHAQLARDEAAKAPQGFMGRLRALFGG
ncbi:MAG: hypothetical protein KC613_25195 [Myxococcales bacterium]|nr:hypothetical protein [Myxococcales bacterium]MCB9524035.1 hypothetical protein [Myxococcales bacterium]